MSFRKIKPTKSNLIRLNKRLKFVEKGKKFLDYKRTELIQEIRNLWDVYKKQRRSFYNLFKKLLLKLNETYMEQGKNSVILISKIGKIQFKPSINIKTIKKIGVALPQIEFDLEQQKKLPPYSFSNTSKHLDGLMNLLKVFFNELIVLAENEDVLIRYAFNFQKINRRIQGLKNIIQPQIEIDIKNIEKILEEVDRENFISLKKTKDLIKKVK
ncbi:MAG: V-type ATP synthase subunit D [Candidatus Lokiarchaeota archaeon]|nr:V-type ATP synthase subunit D [Candidatus Lokiarchaeota archaeon]